MNRKADNKCNEGSRTVAKPSERHWSASIGKPIEDLFIEAYQIIAGKEETEEWERLPRSTVTLLYGERHEVVKNIRRAVQANRVRVPYPP